MYLILAYHHIGDLNSDDPGNDPVYTLSEHQFQEQMDVISSLGIPVISQSELILRLLNGIDATGPTLVLGFDDGNGSDLDVVVPLLKGRFPAIFYLTVDHLGKRLPLSAPQDLVQAGFEVGCHGWHHRYLTHLSGDALQQETFGAKAELSRLAGTEVEHFAYPGGRWNVFTNQSLRKAGFLSAVNTQPTPFSVMQELYQIPRIGMKNTFDLVTFEGLILQDSATLAKIRRRSRRVKHLRWLVGDNGLDWLRKRVYS